MIEKTLMNTLTEKNKGIFTSIYELKKLIWLDEDTALLLDSQYYFGHSGQKRISPLFDNLINSLGIDNAVTTLANNIALIYGDKWNRTYEALHLNYEVNKNYNVSEVETPDITTETNSSSNSKVVNTSNGSNESLVSGFNSMDYVPANSNNSDSTNTSTADASDNYSNSSIHESGKRQTEKSGVIGSNNQRLIKEELDLRRFLFYDDMYKDVDSMLVLKIY